jgi:hypothetical protein
MQKQLKWIILALSILLLVFLVSRFAEKFNRIPIEVKIALSWFQILSLFSGFSSHWPSSFKKLFSIMSVFNVDVGFLGLSCALGFNSYLLLLGLKLSLPFIMSIILILRRLLSMVLQRSRGSSIERSLNLDLILGRVVFLCDFFALQLFKCLFQIFRCTKTESGIYVLTNDPSVVCSEGA